MTERKTEHFGFGKDELSKWESLQDVTFSEVRETTSTFFTLRRTKAQAHTRTISSVLAMLVLSISGIVISLQETPNLPPLVQFEDRARAMAQFDSLRCLREDRSALLHNASESDYASRLPSTTVPIFTALRDYGSLYDSNLSAPFVPSSLIEEWQSMPVYTDSIPRQGLSDSELLHELARRQSYRGSALSLYTDRAALVTESPSIVPVRINDTPIERLSVRRDNLSIAVRMGGVFASGQYQSDDELSRLRNLHSSSMFGWHYGLQLSKRIRRNFYLFGGFDHQRYHQHISFTAERAVDGLPQDELIAWRYASEEYQSMGKMPVDTVIAGTQLRHLAQQNTFRSTQVNMGAGIVLGTPQLQWRPFVGFAIGRMHEAVGRTIGEDLSVITYGVPDDIFHSLQLLGMVGMNAEYRLRSQLSLQLGYQYRKQLNNATYESDLLLRPRFHYLSTGIQFRF